MANSAKGDGKRLQPQPRGEFKGRKKLGKVLGPHDGAGGQH